MKLFSKQKRKIILSLIFILLFIGLFNITFVNALDNKPIDPPELNWWEKMLNIPKNLVLEAAKTITNVIIMILGAFITVITWAIGHVASYNNFVNETPIKETWIIVRDFCNMFFVLILLVIAFATILRIDSYNLKKTLPKLIIMAILINFSRTICGLIIDFSQIIMLTFINAFNNTGGEWINTLGVDKYLTMVKEPERWTEEVDLVSTLMSLGSAIIFLLIAIVVLAVILIVLLMRIIMLWVYVILSPLAFLLSAFPQGEKYASQWWSEFIRQAVIGPVLAFFIWLALTSTKSFSLSKLSLGRDACFGPAEIFCPEYFMSFIIAIGMLIGGLMVSSQLGGAAGSMAGKGIGYIKKGTSFGKQKIAATGKTTAKLGARTGIGLSGMVLRKAGKEGGTGLRGDLHKAGAFMGSWKNDLQTTRQNAKRDKRLSTLKKMGMGDKSLRDLEKVTDSNLGRGIKHGTIAAGAAGLGLATGGIGWAAGGAVVGSRLVAGKLKRGQVDNQKGRENEKEQAKQGKQAEIARLEQNKEEAKKNLEMQLNYDPSENIAKKEAEKEKTIKDLNSEKEVKIKNLDSLLEFHTISKGEYKVKKESIEKEHGEKVEQVSQKHEEFIKEENIKRLAPEDYDKQLRKLDTDFKIQVNDINTRYSARIKNIDGQESWTDKQMKKYQPNRVTIEAARKGADDYKTAEKRVDVLGKGENIHKFSPAAFYSASGQSAVQRAFFEKLASGEAASAQALNNINKTLGQIAAGELKLSKQEKESVMNLKKGLAAYKKSGGDASRLEQTINQVNNIHTGDDEDGRKTVEDFEGQIIT